MGGLAVRGVTKRFGTTPVLHGIDLDVPTGSLTAVLGASGCGKTTLLRLIAGFDRPDRGTITLDGRVLHGPGTSLPPEARHIGYVAQEGALFPHLTVGANITFGLPRRERRHSPRVGELLELVGLDAGYAGRHPHQLSGGQQQRVALARALAPAPAVILLDEPFSSLDAALRTSTRKAVTDALSAAGATTILVTHDQDEALSLADQVAVMRAGLLAQVADPVTLYRQPVDAATAAFVGEANFLPATVADGVARCALGAFVVTDRAGAAAWPTGTATVLVRPEQLTLGVGAASDDAVGADGGGVAATVTDTSYHGGEVALTLRLSTGELLAARAPGHRAPTLGDAVRVVVDGPVHLLPPVATDRVIVAGPPAS